MMVESNYLQMLTVSVSQNSLTVTLLMLLLVQTRRLKI